jgi:O-acetyl-ADP-ribose deacetylase (regulator of RNase III)
MTYREIDGDLVALAKEGKFDIIAHGCNCFCTQKQGIAWQMSKHFDTNNPQKYKLEDPFHYKGNIDKLGRIESYAYYMYPKKKNRLDVFNFYTQYFYGTTQKHLNYAALELCLYKLDQWSTDKHIGLPQIGCGLAGGDWNIVKEIIQKIIKNNNVTVVIYNK